MRGVVTRGVGREIPRELPEAAIPVARANLEWK